MLDKIVEAQGKFSVFPDKGNFSAYIHSILGIAPAKAYPKGLKEKEFPYCTDKKIQGHIGVNF
jgi:hypothetical protein